jgi:hypothetical protein
MSFLEILQHYISMIYYLIDHDFRILTKFVSHFLDFYTILYRMRKFSSETNLEKHLEIEKASGSHSGPTAEMAREQRGRAPAGLLRSRCAAFAKETPSYSLTNLQYYVYYSYESSVSHQDLRKSFYFDPYPSSSSSERRNRGGGRPARFRPAGSPSMAREGPARAEVP